MVVPDQIPEPAFLDRDDLDIEARQHFSQGEITEPEILDAVPRKAERDGQINRPSRPDDPLHFFEGVKGILEMLEDIKYQDRVEGAVREANSLLDIRSFSYKGHTAKGVNNLR